MNDCKCAGFGTTLMVFMLFWKSCDNTIETKLNKILDGTTEVKCKIIEPQKEK